MTTRCGGGFIPIRVFAPPSRFCTNISRNKFCRRTGEGHEERPVRQTIATAGAAAVAQIPEIASPRIHLLSNGTCSVTVTNSGGGYLRWLDLDVTRWRADATCDVSGPFCYIRDLESGTTWSNTHQPVRSPERRYTWTFTPDKAEFRRRSGPCETITEIVVSAEDNAEVRRVTLVNTSRKSCRLELTSYIELALAPHRTDRAHPAFNKLFIETEWLPSCEALVARRRLRGSDDRPSLGCASHGPRIRHRGAGI